MSFLFPIFAAILQAGSFTLDKVILSIRKVDFRTYTGISFPLIFLVTLVIFLIFHPPLSLELFSGNLKWFIALSISLTIFTNIIFYRALDKDTLGEIQTLDLLRFIPIIVFSSIIFTDERNLFVIIPTLIASLAIIWSHWDNGHFKIKKTTLPFFLWSLAIAPLGAALSKVILYTWNPISLELIRSGVAALILGLLFLKHTRKIPIKVLYLLIFTNVLTSIAWILFYFSYQYFGIIHTILIFSLQPLLVYFSSVFLLKEKLQWKKAVAFLIILACIGITQIVM